MNKHLMSAMPATLAMLLSTGLPAEPSLDEGSLLKSIGDINRYYQRVQEKLGGDVDSATDQSAVSPDESDPVTRRVILQPGQQNTAPNWLDRVDSGFRSLTLDGKHEGYRQGRRNPFAPTQLILAAIERGGSSAANLALQPVQQATPIPRMHLRGLINDGAVQAALLEIENAGVYIVREGDTVGLYETGSNAVVRIREINRLNLVVEAGSLGQLFIVR